MFVLIQFLYRLAFGLAAAMAVTSSEKVTFGYFRVHLYVVLGLNTLAAAVAMTSTEPVFNRWPAITGMVLSYLGAVMWLYQIPKAGRFFLVLVTITGLIGSWMALDSLNEKNWLSGLGIIWSLDSVSSGLILGFVIGAMFLGHWYLNNPQMEIGPLKNLLLFLSVFLLFRSIICLIGLVNELPDIHHFTALEWTMFAMRWLFGIIGPALLTWMTWQTLKIPNTQSATGILYVSVLGIFVGELSAMLLSQGLVYTIIYPI